MVPEAPVTGRVVKKLNGFLTGKLKEKISIGIIGTGSGCGTTHLAIALANYLQSGLGKQTAVIEMPGQHDLEHMIRDECRGKQELFHVQYFTGIGVGKIPEILNSGYEAFVLDCGGDYQAAREEFLRCDRKLVMGSISPWKVSAFEHFMRNIIAIENYQQWEFLVLFADRTDRKRIQKRYKMHLTSVPWIENPFYLKKEDLIFLQKLL